MKGGYSRVLPGETRGLARQVLWSGADYSPASASLGATPGSSDVFEPEKPWDDFNSGPPVLCSLSDQVEDNHRGQPRSWSPSKAGKRLPVGFKLKDRGPTLSQRSVQPKLLWIWSWNSCTLAFSLKPPPNSAGSWCLHPAWIWDLTVFFIY